MDEGRRDEVKRELVTSLAIFPEFYSRDSSIALADRSLESSLTSGSLGDFDITDLGARRESIGYREDAGHVGR